MNHPNPNCAMSKQSVIQCSALDIESYLDRARGGRFTGRFEGMQVSDDSAICVRAFGGAKLVADIINAFP
jgi:hypothetical protein